MSCGNCFKMKVKMYFAKEGANHRLIECHVGGKTQPGSMCCTDRKNERIWSMDKDLLEYYWVKKARACKDFDSMGEICV